MTPPHIKSCVTCASTGQVHWCNFGNSQKLSIPPRNQILLRRTGFHTDRLWCSSFKNIPLIKTVLPPLYLILPSNQARSCRFNKYLSVPKTFPNFFNFLLVGPVICISIACTLKHFKSCPLSKLSRGAENLSLWIFRYSRKVICHV